MTTSMLSSSRPYTRWWWFSGPIDDAVIRSQLEWLAANGFGGVEIAWMYPQDNSQLGAPWLSPAWAAPARFAAEYAASLGLGCDFTMGSAWPFGGCHVPPEDASQTWHGPSSQHLEKSWETPLGVDGGPILNHLDRHALARYARRFGAGLGLPTDRFPAPGLFCDSWEVAPDALWTAGFDKAFRRQYGYDILPYLSDLDAHPHVRYDYRKLIAAFAIEEFYRPYTELCHELGGLARVQCHGAPTDIVAAYALADIPESEAILFDVDFATFAASAAALVGRTVVSAEAFTCIYGWAPCPGPGPHQGEERLADLRLIADGLMANGVNQIVWHGMPYNPPGGAQRFYATTHVGPDSPLASEFADFNAYMTWVCEQMRRGQTYADVAVYLPLEDGWMAGELPESLQKPSSKYVYELQETKFPAMLKGYCPLWVTGHFLRDALYRDGKLCCGAAAFSWLYVDVTWLDGAALTDLVRLARAGLPICLARRPQEPGLRQSTAYAAQVAELAALPNVSADWRRVAVNPPLVEGADLPDFWCRVEEDTLILFMAHPATQHLRYPLNYGARRGNVPVVRHCALNIAGRRHPVALQLAQGQSALLTASRTGVEVQLLP
ncbi:MAG TPA: hypothetical protein DCL15_09430 [Chloroflexi bacterium]|nr:hypothetical protein [Chloroflexota bacterium]HHW88097.1 hypothetical protein [Chloroflexota bacterium]